MTDKMIANMKKRIVEYCHYFNQGRENSSGPYSSLGSPKPKVSLYDVFEPYYQSRSNLQDDTHFSSLEQESSLPTSLSPDIAPHTSSP